MKLKLLPARASRSLCTAILVAAVFFLAIYRLRQDSNTADYEAQPPHQDPAAERERAPQFGEISGDCPAANVRHLLGPELDLSRTITYSKRCIKPVVSKSVDRNVVANISDTLFKYKTTVDLKSCAPVELDCDPLPLHVPSPYPKTAFPHLIFGVATAADRFEESVNEFGYWLAGSRAQLVGVVTDESASAKRLEALGDLYAKADMEAKFVRPQKTTDSVSQSHFTIIRNLVAESKPETQWIGLLDDDTFFPSLYRLSAVLAEHDHTQHAYVGALSEDLRAIRTYGFMAFGGAGVFLSTALAHDLEPLLEQCLREARHAEGDALIRDCVYYHSTAKLTHVPELHQMDMNIDATGFYEGGPNPISLHHWKSWYHSPVAAMSRITDICGECFLQRWRIGEDTVFSNGFSIAVYPKGVTHLDLGHMEGTWSGADTSYDHSIGPLRPPLKHGDKKNYKLAHAEFLQGGKLRQVYVYRDENPKVNDEVVELVWEPPKSSILLSA